MHPIVRSRRYRITVTALIVLLIALGGCRTEPTSPASNSPSETADNDAPREPRRPLTVLAVGDINLGRSLGRRLLAGQTDYPFERVAPEISAVDIAFGNLESQLSDQRGQTEGSSNYVFTGPPEGADALASAGFDVVSTANNHAWDYGERAMTETLENLERVKIEAAGTGATLDEAYRPPIFEIEGWRVAFLAVTGIFNSPFEESPARDHVAWADPVLVPLKIKELRHEGVDLVFVSYHGGVEYSPDPTDETRAFARACIAAGADAVIGHHPHIVQGVEWYEGKPIFYSLGNFVFKQFDPWTDLGLAVRLTIRDGEPIDVEYIAVSVDYQPRFLSETEGSTLLDRVATLSGGTLVKRPPATARAPA